MACDLALADGRTAHLVKKQTMLCLLEVKYLCMRHLRHLKGLWHPAVWPTLYRQGIDHFEHMEELQKMWWKPSPYIDSISVFDCFIPCLL